MKKGSALIMTIVLTVLLAIVGTMFLLMARTEKVATSSRSDNEELKLAASSVAGTISQVLANDVPRNFENSRYYDYPGRWLSSGLPDLTDSNDSWLANLEPEKNAVTGIYQWRHITNLYHPPFDPNSQYAYNVQLSSVSQAICDDYPKNIDTIWANNTSLADADGDGVADSRWVKVPNLTTSKGKPVYAAVRIVDNGGMLNINTAYRFSPRDRTSHHVDGTNQMQVNLAALSRRGKTNGRSADAAAQLFNERWDASWLTNQNKNWPNPTNYQRYIDGIIWPLTQSKSYTPFDIADELKLRNRYTLGNKDGSILTRIEEVWNAAYDDTGITTPVDTTADLSKWYYKVMNISSDPCDYNYNHISTTYNVDRIIAPDGNSMIWLNYDAPSIAQANGQTYAQNLYDYVLVPYIKRNVAPPDQALYYDKFAQLTANIIDFRDKDPNVTVVKDFSGNLHYGLERPMIYISELARNFVPDANGSGTIYSSYGIELCKWPDRTQFGRPPAKDWQILIESATGAANDRIIEINDMSFTKTNGRFYVLRYQNPNAKLPVDFNIPLENGATNVDPCSAFTWDPLSSDTPDMNDIIENYDPNNTYKFSYDVYFAGSNSPDQDVQDKLHDDVENADPCSTGIYQGNFTDSQLPFDPYGNTPMDPLTTYYLRIDDVISTYDKNNNLIGTDVWNGDVIYFTTGDGVTKPVPDGTDNLPANEKVFDVCDTIKLRHKVNGTWLVVDAVKVPAWLADTSGATAGTDNIASFQRDILSRRWIQRLWDPVGLKGGTTLGGWNSWTYDSPNIKEPTPLQTWTGDHGRWFRNVGDLGYMLTMPVYYEDTVRGISPPQMYTHLDVVGYPPGPPSPAPADWQYTRLEQNTRIDLSEPNVQKLFQYFTVFNPGQGWSNSGLNSLKVKGRININTAPWYVIGQLPWVSQRNDRRSQFYDPNYRLAEAIVAYRDKTPIPSFPSIDYSVRGALAGTGLAQWWTNNGKSNLSLREEPGFASIGELTTVINQFTLTDPNNLARTEHFYSMWYYVLGNQSRLNGVRSGDVRRQPDMTVHWSRSKRSNGSTGKAGTYNDWQQTGDGAPDDFEERNLIFARISDLVTVHSDAVTAYMLIRLGENGPQRRVIAILDRSEAPTKPAKIIALQQVPDAR